MTAEEAIKQLDGANAMLFNRNMVAFNRAIIMAIAALQEKAEREDPKPLTIEELRQMETEPVYVVPLKPKKADIAEWCAIWCEEAAIPGCDYCAWDFKDYGKTWIAYRHKPKEDHQ